MLRERKKKGRNNKLLRKGNGEHGGGVNMASPTSRISRQCYHPSDYFLSPTIKLSDTKIYPPLADFISVVACTAIIVNVRFSELISVMLK